MYIVRTMFKLHNYLMNICMLLLKLHHHMYVVCIHVSMCVQTKTEKNCFEFNLPITPGIYRSSYGAPSTTTKIWQKAN